MQTYHYVLSTKAQKEAIDLLKLEGTLKQIFQEHFHDNLIESIIQKDGYILNLKQTFDNSSKRALGRKIASQSELGKHVKRFIYDKGKSRSGQLFRIVK